MRCGAGAKETAGEKEKGADEAIEGSQHPNESRRTEMVKWRPETALAVLFRDCAALTSAPAINTMGESEREGSLLGIIY